MFLCPVTQTTYVTDKEELPHPEEAILEAQNAAENLYVHCLSVLTCVGLVSESTSSKPEPDNYFIISCISNDITERLDKKATHYSLNNYNKSKS